MRTSRRRRADRQAELERLRGELAAADAVVDRLQRLVDAVPVGIVRYERDGRVDFVNRRVLETTGAVDALEFGTGARLMVHPDDAGAERAARRAASQGERAEFHYRVRNAGGAWIHVEGTFLPIVDEDGVDSVIAIYRDVTDRVAQNQQMLQFKAIAEVTTDIVGITDLAGEVVYLNPAGRAFMDVDGDHPRHLSRFFEFIPREYHSRLMSDAYETVSRGEVWQGDVDLVRPSDRIRRPMSAVVVGIRDDTGDLVGLAVTYRDLSERKRFESELEHAATHDPLTGLANREQLFQALRTSLDSGIPTTVLFFDLDDFKDVNDSLGHATGDDVLRELARRISGAARSTDLVGRLGGDEFLVICRNVATSSAALRVAAHVLAAVRAPMQVEGRQLSVTGSIGVSIAPVGGKGATAAQLVQEADIAMYRSKRAGRGLATMFDDSMRIEAIDRLELHREVRLALERDEFELYFQPLVHFGRGMVQNFEALIRWNHPRHGLLNPTDFMPVVEQCGLTNAVGRWVFDAACRAVSAMRLVESQTCVGVNVHPDQIGQADFVESITRSMLSARITGEAIAIEITEHAVMADVDQTREVLEELQAIGVSVAIDDFGTGYSNLDLLRRLPVDYLKIDQSFVRGLGIEPGDTQLVRMIVALSEELGITVIAEGVETTLQESELIRLGCRIGQGYLYARPMPFDDAIALLRAQQANPPSKDKIVPVM